MGKAEFEALFVEAINSLRQQAFVPYDTGNLKFNAIKGMWINENLYRIYIDEAVAPYVYFTQERWENGKNPNEGWIEKAVNYIAMFIARKLGGSIQK
jgi:hypothetical protein